MKLVFKIIIVLMIIGSAAFATEMRILDQRSFSIALQYMSVNGKKDELLTVLLKRARLTLKEETSYVECNVLKAVDLIGYYSSE
jgi:hypothetical protein